MRPDYSAQFLSTNERQALAQSIAHGCRLDGRALGDLRRIRCRFAAAEPGCVTARLGDTLVVAKVTHDVVEPWSHRPAEGQLQVNLEIPGPEGQGFGGGGGRQHQLDDEGLRAQRALERCFKESRCLDVESLCIVPGERVFLVRVTATVLNNDGNVVDCAAMAVVLALADYRRPDVSLVQGVVRVGENAPVPLNLNFYPVVQTFGLFDSDGKYIVSDLSAKEEALASCRVVVAMSANREICCLHTIGGLPLDRRHLIGCARQAARRVRCIASLLDRALAARRLDTLELLPAMLSTSDIAEAEEAAHPDAEMPGEEDDDGELPSSAYSGSDMEVASPSSPSAFVASSGVGSGGGGNPYNFAVVADSVDRATDGAAAASSATAKHVELGLRFIRSAMQQQQGYRQTPHSTDDDGGSAAALVSSAVGGVSGYYDADDDEEDVTIVTQLM